MKKRIGAAMRRHVARAAVSTLAAAALTGLGGCAPDAMQNYKATGFNGYLDSLKTACPNLQIGANDIGLWLQYGGVTDNYNYWLDMTSRLYYNRISQAEYRSAVGAQLGASTGNDVAFNCMFAALPALRDSAPPPAGVIRY